MSPAIRDLLLILLPPPDLVRFMLEVLRRKRMRGDPVPESWGRWLHRTQNLRDGCKVYAGECLTDGERGELERMVRG
jgi:hypothetical protein